MWGFGTVINNSVETVMLDFAVGANAATSGGTLNATRGNAIMEIGALGAVYFTDVGQQAGGPHSWAVDVQVNNDTWRWFYDGTGALDVAVNADASFVLSGHGQQKQGRLVAPGELATAESAVQP
jgi:hypothetical protein